MKALVSLSTLIIFSVAPLAHGQPVPELIRSRATDALIPDGAERRVLLVAGHEREYFLIRPPTARGPSPVVFVLHGGAVGDGRQTFRYGFQELGARDGVVTVHPSGIGEGWNDGRDTPFLLARSDAADDVAFFRAMIDSLVDQKIIDPARVYVTGGSNGGMMTMRLVCELGDKMTAAAPFIALLPERLAGRCTPARSIPMLIMLGTDDRMMPFEGGAVAAMSGDDRGTVLSSNATFDFWRKQNRCDEGVSREQFPDADPTDETRVRLEKARGCAAALEMVVVEGGGHRLPGEGPRKYQNPVISALSGVSSQDVKGRDLIWKFFFETTAKKN